MALIQHFPKEAPPAFELKGRLMALTVLRVLTADLEQLRVQLDARIAAAPELFHNFPVLLDFQALAPEAQSAFDIARLDRLLRERSFVPVGIRGAEGVLAGIAAGVGLGVVAAGGGAAVASSPDGEGANPAAHNLLVQEPVRSGQQVYARGGDLIVLATVSPGAEILADGNIHVYGLLRGRALAGVGGNTEARIYCRRLEAELVSVAGHYRVSEQIPDGARARPVQVLLRGERLVIEPL